MLILLAPIGCFIAILATTIALAEVTCSPSLAREKKVRWALLLLVFTALAAFGWFASSTRSRHAPVNLLDGPGQLISRTEIEIFVKEVDAYRDQEAC